MFRRFACLTLAAVFALPLFAAHDAQAAPPKKEIWSFTRDVKLDGQLKDAQTFKLELIMTGDLVSGHLHKGMAGKKANNSHYVGQIVKGKREVLILRQYDDGYISVWTGYRVSKNEFRGTWIDGSKSAGDFVLKR